MKTVIIEGLSQDKYESYLNKRLYEKLYYPTIFPRKNVNTLDGKTLIGEKGSRIAAFIISYDSKSPELGRKSLKTQVFDIPKIAVKRIKTEKEILEHYVTKAVQGQDAVIEDYFDDADFVVDACRARQEWLTLQALSLTKIQLSASNNPLGITNETVIDFGMVAANKKTVAVIWNSGNSATMTPIADFKAVVKSARAKGLKFTKALMHPDAFDLITGCTEYENAAKSLLKGESIVLGLQGLETVNSVFTALRLPPIALIETSIGIVGKSGESTETNPWSETHVLFISEDKQGNMYNGPIAEELEKPVDVIQAKSGNVLVSVKKGFDPINITTKGECNVFPSWPNVNRCFNLYTANTSTWA